MNGARGQFATRLGFILAAAGSAVGLGNIWKFPYLAGANGGAVFLILYLGIVFTVGLSVMLAELAIGRAGEKNPVGAFKHLQGGPWVGVGYLGVFAGFVILSFYSVVGGWTLAYALKTATGLLGLGDAKALGGAFASFVGDPVEPVLYHAVFMGLTVAVVSRGINSLNQRVMKGGLGGQIHLMDETTGVLGKIASDIQAGVMQARMVPIKGVFSRFRRIVRDISSDIGKNVNLVIEGEETELDKNLVDSPGDPLTHMIRNAIDHGIEDLEIRRKLGKPERGVVTLRAFHQGNNICIVVADDGKGLNAELLVQSALTKKLITKKQADQLTEKETSVVEEYLERGGDALILVENVLVTTPDKPLSAEAFSRNPSLNNILNQWGVNVGDDIVVDLASHAGSDVGSPATRNYEDHKALTEGLDYTFYVRPRSIVPLKGRRSTLKLAPIVMTASVDKSWAETDRTLKVLYDPLVEIKGPVALGFVMMEDKRDLMTSDTRLIVFTDADFLTNIYINQYSNARMGLNAVNWLVEVESQVFVAPKDIKVERLDLTSKQRRQVAVVLFLMPLMIALGGVMVWWRRC